MFMIYSVFCRGGGGGVRGDSALKQVGMLVVGKNYKMTPKRYLSDPKVSMIVYDFTPIRY